MREEEKEGLREGSFVCLSCSFIHRGIQGLQKRRKCVCVCGGGGGCGKLEIFWQNLINTRTGAMALGEIGGCPST